MAAVADDDAVLHRLEVLLAQHGEVAGDRADDVPHLRRLQHGHYPVAVHHRLQRPQGVDLGDDDLGAHPARPLGQPAATPAIATHDEVGAGQQLVGGAHDAVQGALTGAVAVIEQVLRVRVVHGDDRVFEHALLLHGAQPDHPCRRLLGAADDLLQQLAAVGVDHAHGIGAIIHRQVRVSVQRGVDMAVISVVVLALDREGLDAILMRHGRRRIVLRRERIGGADGHLRAARLQGERQVCRLGGHVQAGRQPDPRERPLPLKAGPDAPQHRHIPGGPLDPGHPLACQGQILHIAL